MNRGALLFCAGLLAIAGADPAGAQAAAGLTRQQELSKLRLQERQLQLEQRRTALATVEQELAATRQLYESGFVPLLTFNQASNSYEDARLQLEEAQIMLEETTLDLLKNATRIVVRDARKYRDPEGKSMVDVTLENASDVRDALIVDPSLDEQDLRTLLKIENIFVSILGSPKGGAIVAEPYEVRIPSLAVGEELTLTYRLLRDEDGVAISLSYLDIEDHLIPVILRKGGRQALPSINSAQFSQTGELQQKVHFDLTLERLSEEERSFALAVVGLPRRIDFSFVAAGAKVSQVKFDENKARDTLSLQLAIPERLDRRFIGRTRTFYALVTETSQYPLLRDLRTRYGDEPVPEAEVKALRARYVKLELIPKGTGKLEVLVANKYQRIEVGQELRVRVEFLNRGSVAVQDIKAALDLPYQWESEVDPKTIKRLGPDERAAVTIRARPPDHIAVGNYELGIEAQGQVGNENVESLEKNLNIHIGTSSSLTGNVILVGILFLLVVGIGVATVRISRR